MNVRFHPPLDQAEYAEKVFTLLLQAALPKLMTQLEQAAGESRADASGEESAEREVLC